MNAPDMAVDETSVSPEPVTVSEKSGSFIYDPFGARIKDLQIGGTRLLVDPVRADGRYASTHPCTPNFDTEMHTDYALPRHGPGRTAVWTVEHAGGQGDASASLSYDVQGGKYPGGMHVRQDFSLVNGLFRLTTTHINRGPAAAPVNFGEHFYWNTFGEGWDGLTINGTSVGHLVENNGMIPLKSENSIQLPGLDGRIILRQNGLPAAVLWAAFGRGHFDESYVCIEPVEGDHDAFWNSAASFIKPDESRETVIEIQLG